MKLYEIKPVFEKYENDFSGDAGQRLSDSQFQQAFNAVKSHELSASEIKGLAAELSQNPEFGRTTGSAAFLLNRMYILVHGKAPDDVTERQAEKMFVPSGPMNKFAVSKGIDAVDSIRRAKIDLKGRKKKVNISQDEATKMMSDFVTGSDISPETKKAIGDRRGDIISDIMTGLTAQEAVQRHLKEHATQSEMDMLVEFLEDSI